MSVTHAVDLDEIQTTRGEKVLAVVLTVFLLIGLVWAYVKLDTRTALAAASIGTAAEQAAVDAYTQAQNELARPRARSPPRAATSRSDASGIARHSTRDNLRLRSPPTTMSPSARSRTPRNGWRRLEARVAETRPAADAANERRSESIAAKQRREARDTFLLRLAFLLPVLGGAYGLFHALRGSRSFTLALAAVGAGAILTLVFAGDYVEDYVEWNDTGLVVLDRRNRTSRSRPSGACSATSNAGFRCAGSARASARSAASR